MWSRLKRRVRALLQKQRLEDELDAELRFHLDKEIEQNLARGMSRQAAHRAARRSFGSVEEVKEQAREVRGVRLLEQVAQDVRHGLRLIRKAPGFTAVAVLSLSLGIGANTALFSVADALLLRTLPVPAPERLVLFEWEAGRTFRNSGTDGWSPRDPTTGRWGSSSFHTRIFQVLADQPSAVGQLFAFAGLREVNLEVGREAEVASGQYVSGGYFGALGIRPWLGGLLAAGDDRPDARPAVVVSHAYWQARLGGDADGIGTRIHINTVAATVVGVSPPGFHGTMQVEARPSVFLPLAMEPLLNPERSNLRPAGDRRGSWWLHLMGRLRPGATVLQAQESLNGLFQSLAVEMMPPPGRADQPATLPPDDVPRLVAHSGGAGMRESRQGYAATIYQLFGVVALVLLIACTNLASLQLARSATRRTEVTLRLALGAGRWRVVRQLLTESLLLASLGGVVGVGLALVAQQLLPALGRGLFPPGVGYELNGRVLAFSVASALLAGMLFGVAPALRATRLDLGTALKQGGRGTGGAARSRLSKALVIAQVAMSLILLLGAGLFLRTVRNLQLVELGFNQHNLLLFTLRPGALGYQGPRLEQLYQQLFSRLDSLPGVEGATFNRVRLMTGAGATDRIILPGETARSLSHHSANLQVVRENYFETMQIPRRQGRAFSAQDREGAPKVVIVNQTLARRYFPDGQVLGRRIGLDSDFARELEIVGVVADSRYNRRRKEIAPLVFLPWRQHLAQIGAMSFAVRVAGDPLSLVPEIRRAVSEVAPGLPLADVRTQVVQSQMNMAAETLRARLLTFFALLALLLAAIGLYGLLAYSVAQRTMEIGVRMALGAQMARVRRMVVVQGLWLAAAGVLLGGLAALALTPVVQSQLYGVQASDPATLAAVAATLLAVALFACWIPAQRATRVDPMIALRSE